MKQLSKTEALHRFAEFGRLSAGLFHDIGSPIAALTLSVDRLKENKQRNYQIDDDLESILKASTKLKQLVHAVQKISTQKEELTNFSLNTEIQDVCDLLRHHAHKINTTITIRAKKPFYLYGNPLRFHQVILNLVSNAIQAIEYSGKSKHNHIRIQIRDKYGALYVEVENNGPEIPFAIQSKIFLPFFTTKLERARTGLGLSQSKDIIEKEFNGSLTMKSNSRRTRFTITIKRALGERGRIVGI